MLICANGCDRGNDSLGTTLVAKLALAPSSTVADIGAGDGSIAAIFAKALPTGRVIATELRSRDVEKLSARNPPNVEARLATMTDSALHDHEVDLVLMCRVDHLLADRRTYLAALVPKLNAGGRVVLVNNAREEVALVATVRELGWKELDAFTPAEHLFARVYRP